MLISSKINCLGFLHGGDMKQLLLSRAFLLLFISLSIPFFISCSDEESSTPSSFISVWRVGTIGFGNGNRNVTLPLVSNSTYNFTVNWGDGSSEAVTTHNITHTYAESGDYTIKISGTLPAWSFYNGGDKDKLIEVQSLGRLGWKSLQSAFQGCSNLIRFVAGDTDTSEVTEAQNMFNSTISLEEIEFSGFDTSKITTMTGMFRDASGLTSLDLSSFNTSNVINMSLMFYGTFGLTSLDLSSFDTSKITSMSFMFYGASGLTSLDLSYFNTSKVEYMSSMFNGASALTDLNVTGWDINQVTSSSSIFTGTPGNLTLTCSEGVPSIFSKNCRTDSYLK